MTEILMTREKAIHKMKFSKDAYQKLIDEEVDKGILVGTGIKGEWEADAPLTEEYVAMRDACDMAARSLEAWDKVKEELADNATFDNVDDLVLCMRIINKHLKEVEENG
jgi:hypothetical protein